MTTQRSFWWTFAAGLALSNTLMAAGSSQANVSAVRQSSTNNAIHSSRQFGGLSTSNQKVASSSRPIAAKNVRYDSQATRSNSAAPVAAKLVPAQNVALRATGSTAKSFNATLTAPDALRSKPHSYSNPPASNRNDSHHFGYQFHGHARWNHCTWSPRHGCYVYYERGTHAPYCYSAQQYTYLPMAQCL